VKAAVIGAGPAGLMAAEVMARAGADVTVYEAMPSPARKFLMAGKSGLNLTFEGNADKLLSGYGKRADVLRPILERFDHEALRKWAEDLGQETFTGSTGRVFPKSMKTSPLLRAWLERLDEQGVQLKRRWRWVGWSGMDLKFETPDGVQTEAADTTVLACGGASWHRLGSDGAWANHVPSTPFRPSNVGVLVNWSGHMTPHMGAPVKSVAWRAGGTVSRGEATLTQTGLEGGGIYAISASVREGAELSLDLLPDQTVEVVASKLAKPRGKSSLSNHLRKALRLSPVKLALAQEWARPLPGEPEDLARLLKALPVPVTGLMPMDGAISTAGGVPFEALDETLMLKERPGVFCAGEMLDWEAPTGGWLLTACFATGVWAGQHAARWARAS
jgi:uncharacterized flavoprotein (TIGR03862 family)